MNAIEIFSTVREAVVAIIPEIPQKNVILANQSGDAPQGDYITINPMTGSSRHGYSSVNTKNFTQTDDFVGVETTSKIQTLSKVSVNIYGRARPNNQSSRYNIHEFAARLTSADSLPDVADLLRAKGAGIASTGGVVSLDAIVSGRYESRAEITLNIWHEIEIKTTTNAIYGVDVTIVDHDDNLLGEVK